MLLTTLFQVRHWSPAFGLIKVWFWTSSVSIPQKLVRNVNEGDSPQAHGMGIRASGSDICMLLLLSKG